MTSRAKSATRTYEHLAKNASVNGKKGRRSRTLKSEAILDYVMRYRPVKAAARQEAKEKCDGAS